MGYELGIDLGTSYTAAAVCRAGDARVVTLGSRSAAVATAVYLGPDGTVLFGEAAERRALTDPGRVVREFKRRIGDDVPLVVDGRPYPAHDLAAWMVRWVVKQVVEEEGGPPSRIAVARPANWGAHKKELFTGALRAARLRVLRLAEPQAAAVAYAAAERVEPGSTIAVYDLGGGTFDASVVRKTDSGAFELLGEPDGIEDLGGVDFDEAVFRHVAAGLGDTLDALDPADPDVLSAVARLRRECVEAKEALSADTDVTIPVLLPGVQTTARLTRAEFEGMIHPDLERTIAVLGRTVASAGLTPQELTAVLLVGGSSRIPLVTRLVSAEFGLPVAVDVDPRGAIALGAARVLSEGQTPRQTPRQTPVRPDRPASRPQPRQRQLQPRQLQPRHIQPRQLDPRQFGPRRIEPERAIAAPPAPALTAPAPRRHPPLPHRQHEERWGASSGSFPGTRATGPMTVPSSAAGPPPGSPPAWPTPGRSTPGRSTPGGRQSRRGGAGLLALGTVLLTVALLAVVFAWPALSPLDQLVEFARTLLQ